MGHDVVTCKFCGSYVMEGRNDWDCDCGGYCGESTGYVWMNQLQLKQLISKSQNENKGNTLADYLSGNIQKNGRYVYCGGCANHLFDDINQVLKELADHFPEENMYRSLTYKVDDVYDTEIIRLNPLALEDVVSVIKRHNKQNCVHYLFEVISDLDSTIEYRANEIVELLITDINKYYPKYCEFMHNEFSCYVDWWEKSDYLFTVTYEDLAPYID